ncbi:hypothetical protein A374_01794 [Fictibacillus macauensis ZFHKF-1]|uniref:DUF4309 domain-containing protein n=1 Tax=Fictibacillus macauensis ZFHKF-1 TaxID=1196324 RepID=I8UJF6_9BACL|nr:YjgB family protein [Fictibacillus macauensis]EIT86948.1 hypothetical protein A374_01794 [Fictibacillus macauensis ZFHKF-1]
MNKKAVAAAITASLLGGSLMSPGVVGASPTKSPSQAHTVSESDHEAAVKLVHNLYKHAKQGTMQERKHSTFVIAKTTMKAIHKQWGEPSTPRSKRQPFETYHAEMGNPGYAFSYYKNDTLKEIRFLGTNVERKHGLGSVTPKLLIKEIGKPSKILTVPNTHEKDYVYHRGSYDLHFIIGKDGKAAHVNLKKR